MLLIGAQHRGAQVAMNKDYLANWTLSQWDRCLSSFLIRSGLGLSFGVVFSVLLFKRRAWPAWVGLGFGAGRAWEECDNVSRGRKPRFLFILT